MKLKPKIFQKYLLLSFGFIFTFSLFAQENLDRSIPPKLSNPKIISLPECKVAGLKNDLPVYLIEKHDQPIISLSMVIKGGSYFDGKLPGLASVTAELLTKGTKTRNAKEIASRIEFLGASLNCDAGWDAVEINLDFLNKYMNETLDIFSDCLLNPSFSEQEILRSIGRRLEEIEQLKSQPDYITSKAFSKELYKDHPYGNSSFGDEKSLPLIKRNNIKDYYNKFFIANNAFIVIVGDFDPEKIIDKLNSLLKGWKKGEEIKYKGYPFPEQKNAEIIIIDRPDAVQSSLKIGFIGAEKNNPEIPILNVMNTYFGGYFRCQLIANLREKNGFTYGASSSIDTRKYKGPFAITTEVRTEITAKAVEEILVEIDSIKNKPISTSRLNEVKNVMFGSFPTNLQSYSQLNKVISGLKLYNLPDDYYNIFFEQVSETYGDDILKTAKKFFDIHKLLIVITGDAQKIEPDLKKIASVKVIREQEQLKNSSQKKD